MLNKDLTVVNVITQADNIWFIWERSERRERKMHLPAQNIA